MGSSSCIRAVVMVVVVVVGMATTGRASEEATPATQMRDECRGEVDKLEECIAYATGKEEEPTVGCCRRVTELRNSHPECLCFVIQKANCGKQVVFSMVLQIQRLMALPDQCRLTGFNNITICPALLGLPPGSPDRAIFNGTDPQRQSTTCERSSALSARFSNGRRFALAASSAIFSSIFAF